MVNNPGAHPDALALYNRVSGFTIVSSFLF